MPILDSLQKSSIRIWTLHPNDPPFIWYHDLGLAYLLWVLVDTVGMSLNDIKVNYAFFTEKCINKNKDELPTYDEEYFLFFMEDFFHSADYARWFIEEMLKTLEEKNIVNKKIIIFSHKTEKSEAEELMKQYKNISVFVHDDIEYFFHAYFWEKKQLIEIPNILYNVDWIIHKSIESSIVDTDISKYIQWAYHNGYYTRFAKSKDTTISLIDEDDEHKSIHFEMHQPKEILKTVIRESEEKIMLSTGRWCKYKCSYCYRWAKYSKIRQIPNETIEKDLKYLYSLGYHDMLFYDDCFLTTNIDRLDSIIELMKKYPFRYHISIRFEMCNEEVLKKLSEANIWSIQIWLQSTGASANKTSKRWFHEWRFEHVIKELKLKWIRISIDTILWLPDDSISWFIQTIKYAISLKPSSIVTNTLYLNPRTELYNKKEEFWIKTREARGALKYFKTKMIRESTSFSTHWIEFCRKFLIECQKNIHSIRFIIR